MGTARALGHRGNEARRAKAAATLAQYEALRGAGIKAEAAAQEIADQQRRTIAAVQRQLTRARKEK
jgi:hypothetical protein